MDLSDFISSSLLAVRDAGLRPEKVHFDLCVAFDPVTRQTTVVSGSVSVGSEPFPLPFALRTGPDVTGAQITFSVPVTSWR